MVSAAAKSIRRLRWGVRQVKNPPPNASSRFVMRADTATCWSPGDSDQDASRHVCVLRSHMSLLVPRQLDSANCCTRKHTHMLTHARAHTKEQKKETCVLKNTKLSASTRTDSPQYTFMYDPHWWVIYTNHSTSTLTFSCTLL